jgi:hypothetical protein
MFVFRPDMKTMKAQKQRYSIKELIAALFRHKRKRQSRMLSVEELNASIEMEISRAERYNEPFTLCLLSKKSGDNLADDSGRLVQVLEGRMRSTDVMGWIDEATIGLLLTDTTLDKAHCCVQALDAVLNLAESRLSYDLVSFPSREFFEKRSAYAGFRSRASSVAGQPEGGRDSMSRERFFLQ